MKKLLLNPFEDYNEIKLLLTGIFITATGSFLAYFFSGRFDGVIDFHLSKNVTLLQPFIDNIINIACLFLFLYVTGKIVNSRTRMVDILNTTLISRLPLYFLPFTNINGFMATIEIKINPADPGMLNLSAIEMTALIFVGFLSIALLIWFVILLYNGFKTATNAKLPLHKVYFAMSIVLAEIVSKYLFTTIHY